jgi:hypothetical protein
MIRKSLYVSGGRSIWLGLLTVMLFSSMLIFSTKASGQEYRGIIYGRVTDAKGALVPNATVIATGPQQTYRGVTSGSGEYTIPYLGIGVYSVTASAPGFISQERTGVHVDVSAKIGVNFELKVGGGSETVTVNGNAQDLDLNTVDASGGTIMDPEKVQNLPLNGRQVYMMLNLVPGVKNTTTAYGPAGNSGTRGWDESNGYSINGQSGNYNQFSLNGAPISQQGGGGAGTWNIAPNLDAVEEFKVMTNTYDAQYGREAGGTVNTVLKSGTDHYHGTLFDFWRNSVLDSNYYQNNQSGTAKPFHNQHQWGGSFGGPILRGKTYFFGSFEGWREVSPSPVLTTTATAGMLQNDNGDYDMSGYLAANGYSNIYDPATTRACTTADGCTGYTRDPFPNNIIPANRVSTVGLNILKVYPTPNLSGYTDNYLGNNPSSYKYNQPIVRVDHVFSDATRMYAMFAWWSGKENRNTSGLPGAAAQGNINNYRSSLTQVLDATHTFKPTLFGDLRIAFNRAYNRSPDGAVAAGTASLTASDLGLTMPQIPTTTHNYAPEIEIYDNYIANAIGNTVSPTLYETYDLAPSVTQVLGRHNLHYGADLMLYHDIPTGVGSPNGVFTFGPDWTQQDPNYHDNDGAGLASLLLGYPGGTSTGNSYVQYWDSVYESYNYYALFIQDDWKMLPRLTLNIGLRWETESSPRDRHNRLSAGFCETCENPVSSSLSAQTLANGAAMTYPMYGGLQFASGSFSAYKNYFGTILPKFGFSYLLSKDLVLRGGWGLSTALGIELGSQSTWEQDTQFSSSTDGGYTPTDYFRNGNPYPNGVTVPVGNAQGLASGVGDSISFDQRDRKIPRTQSYSFGLQGSAPLHSVWDLEYVGSYSTRMRQGTQLGGLSSADLAAGHADPQYLDQAVANPFYGVLASTTSLGSSPTIQAKVLMSPYPQFYGDVYNYANPNQRIEYNSMVSKLEKRISGGGALTKGLSLLASFTWSKAMNTALLNNYGADTSGQAQVDAKPHWVISSSDRPWDFAFSGLYGLPIGKGGLIGANAGELFDRVLGGWQLDWIFTNDGGVPVSYPSSYTYGCGDFNIRPSKKSWGSYLNNSDYSCFASRAEYTAISHVSRTTAVRAPWAQQTQLGLEKKFAIREGVSFQFKAEAFNLTNTPIFASPSTSNPKGARARNNNVADPNAPGAWTGYGTVGATQQNFPRQVQFSGKISF